MQEKKLVAEKLHKETLKNEITEIIHLAGSAMENSMENLYCAYETARNIQEKELREEPTTYQRAEQEEAQISFQVWDANMDYTLRFNMLSGPLSSISSSFHSEDVFVDRFFYESDVFERLKETLKSYSVNRVEVTFDSRIVFDFRKCLVSLAFSGKCKGDWKANGCESIKKFISDMKELFTISNEIPEAEIGSYSNVDLTITINCFGIDITKFGEENEWAVLKMPIDELNVSTRAHNIFKNRLKISTVGELAQLSERELKCVRGMGPMTFSEIKKKLGELGITMKE